MSSNSLRQAQRVGEGADGGVVCGGGEGWQRKRGRCGGRGGRQVGRKRERDVELVETSSEQRSGTNINCIPVPINPPVN